MRFRTAIALFLSIINALWLLHVFVCLLIFDQYIVTEPIKAIAAFEAILMVCIAALSIERLIRLRERK